MTNNDFFQEGYKLPESSNYMKFKAKDNRFRILSKPIIGYEWWTGIDKDRKPNRVRTSDEVPEAARLDKTFNLKHFWAMVVWNYQVEKVQILEVTQKTIQSSIESLVNDPDWGVPFSYDILVKKEGEGLETEYQVNPKPQKEVDPKIVKQYKSANINLEALYDGGDPFAASEDVKNEDLNSI